MAVSPQIHFAIERSSTLLTSERFESEVLTAVRNEIGRLAKAFATLATFMGFLSRMNKHVFLHVRLLMKPFPAVITRERPDIGVNEHVRRQGRGAFEMLSTGFALEYLNTGVRFFMLR